MAKQKASGIYRVTDLAAATGMTVRRVRYYVERGIVPRPSRTGTGPVYNEDHLVRLRAVRTLRAQGVLLDKIVARLAKASPAELLSLGAPPAGAAPSAASMSPAELASPALPTSGQHWQRIELMPGLEVHVRRDAGPVLVRLAEEIRARYALTP